MTSIWDNVSAPSRFMKKEHTSESGVNLTFQSLEKENVAREDDNPEHKWVVYWSEDVPPLVLNKTNLDRMKKLQPGVGDQVNVYIDMEVKFQGNVGGLRVRAPVDGADFDDAIPF